MNLNLYDLKSSFQKKKIDKKLYIDMAYENFHAHLFTYQKILKESDIKEIVINEEGVFVTFSSGVKMLCPEFDRRSLPIETINFGCHEKDEMKMQYKLLQGCHSIFDIGANHGWYSLELAKKFPRIEIYAFEPLNLTYDFLKKNINLNQVSNIQAYNFGFSNEAGLKTFFYDSSILVNASLANVAQKDNINKVEANFETLDSFTNVNNIPIDFIKCDVEGAELLVFQGAEKTLNKFKPIVFSEMLRKWSEQFNYSPNQIIEFFKTLNYSCFSIINSGENLSQYSLMTDDCNETNFIFLHIDEHVHLIEKYLLT